MTDVDPSVTTQSERHTRMVIRWRHYLLPLNNRSFRGLFIAQLASDFGDALTTVAVMWFVYSRTGSALRTAGVPALLAVAQVAIGPIAGVFADRWNRARTMIVCDWARSVMIAGLALGTWAGWAGVGHAYAATVAARLFTLFFGPSRGALIPQVLAKDDLMAANALTGFTNQSVKLIGLAVSGAIVAVLGPWPALLADSLTFAFSAVAIGLTPGLPPGPLESRERGLQGYLGELADGLHTVLGSPPLRVLPALGVIVNTGSGLVLGLTPVYAARAVHSGAFGYSVFEIALLAGIALGSAAVGLMAPREPRVTMGGGLVVCALAIAGLSQVRYLIVAAGLYVIWGASVAFVNVPMITLIQRQTPEQLLGRVLAFYATVVSASTPLALAVGGWAAQHIGVRGTYLLGGLLVLAGGPFAAFSRTLGRASTSSSA